MAQRKEIVVTISPTGEVSFVVQGVKGKACLAETKFLEDALGTVTNQEPTGEMYESDVGVDQTIKGRYGQ